MGSWWDKIKTSRDIENNREELDGYRISLKPGDITLIGLITDGGVGLQTGNNGKFVGVLDSTPYSARVRQSRSSKLLSAIQAYKIKELSNIKTIGDSKRFLDEKSEEQIRILFDELKDKYGRDIFGQGYLFRIVSSDEIADIEQLSDDEKLNGIKGTRSCVPYDKGDRDGNRWYLRTPYYIDWCVENVNFLKLNSGKNGVGMPVVRNPQFYFRKGFCWSDIHTVLIKCRLKTNGVHDVKSMSLFSLMEEMFPEYYLISILNSTFISHYDHNFVNNTQTFQMNDARQIPVPVPNEKQKLDFKEVFDMAYDVKVQQFEGEISSSKANTLLFKTQKRLDKIVYEIYGFSDEEIEILEGCLTN